MRIKVATINLEINRVQNRYSHYRSTPAASLLELDAGHFTLEMHGTEIINLIRDFPDHHLKNPRVKAETSLRLVSAGFMQSFIFLRLAIN
jgi:hypothetical protein